MCDVWFWQQMASPHMAGLARALARAGCRVSYVAECDLSDHRRSLGWKVPPLDNVALRYAPSRREVAECVSAAGRDSVHLCQGLRANGLVSCAQRQLARRGLQQWVLMETVDDDNGLGALKRTAYAALFRWHRTRITGVLACGHRTSDWVIDCGMPRTRVFPFAYFLEDRGLRAASRQDPNTPFSFGFVGQFIARKRLPLLVDALASLPNNVAKLTVVGSGPLESAWRAYAEQRLPGRVRWIGVLPSAQVLELLGTLDCLVLPSRHDGWGAVVSEALMCGTPAICSDSCGAAGAVTASGFGGVFAKDDLSGLANLLSRAIAAGRPSSDERAVLSNWATSLGANVGARYLLDVLAHVDGSGLRPEVPWVRRTTRLVAEPPPSSVA